MSYLCFLLGWALSAGKNSKHDSIDTLYKTNVAISRYGSGSHIMAFVLADQREWLKKNEKPFDFTVLHNFKAMRDAVNDGSCDYFMWETFTTKPYHDSGEIKRIGQITPPWPAFLFAAHTDLLASDKEGLKRVLGAIQRATQLFMDQKEDESVKHVMRILEYPEEDVRRWFKTVHYAADHQQVSRNALNITLSTLLNADVVSEPTKKIEQLVDLEVAQLIE
jgi:ABC-type nitrate/sulfonate/bicarbonate transport system substrate-binding protein